MLNPTTLDEAFSLARATEARFTNLQILEFLRSYSSTLGEAFFRARITKACFEDENNQAVDTIVGDQEDLDVKDKQVKKADDREIENIKDKEGKNVEDQQGSERDDDTNNDDVGYMRQPIKDEVLKGRDVFGEKSREVFSVTPWAAEGGRRVLCYVQGNERRKRKKSVGCSNGRWDCALFGALVFSLFKPGPDGTHENDWEWPKCENVNYSFRTACNMRKCNTPKPGSKVAKPAKSSKADMPEGSWKFYCPGRSNMEVIKRMLLKQFKPSSAFALISSFGKHAILLLPFHHLQLMTLEENHTA
ncbi:hypothetical protein Tco_0007644 [Tanacetum coccineum]